MEVIMIMMEPKRPKPVEILKVISFEIIAYASD